jgi:phenylacetate-CoA ligase
MRLLRFLPRFRRAYRELSTLQARENWSRVEIETWQLERLNNVWQHAVAHVPYYRQISQEAGLPPRFANLDEYRACVPMLPKQLVQTQPKRFLSEAAPSGSWRSTSGSTGLKTAVFWANESYRETLRCKYRFQAMWGLDIFDRVAFLWGRSATYKPGLKGWIARWRMPVEDWLRNRLRLPAYLLGRANLQDHLRRIARFQPAGLYAYSTAAYLLAREAQSAGFRCDSLRLVTLTSEATFPQLIDTVEHGLGVPAVSEYGSVECGFLAFEGPDRTLRVREDIVLLETQPREDGRHDILVTMLTNPAFPLVRYVIGDVTDAPLTRPERGFTKMHNIAGRENDLVLSRSGLPLHCTCFNHIFENLGGVRCWHVHQDIAGSVEILVETNDPGVALKTAELEQRIGDIVEGYPVRVEHVAQLPLTMAGKHRWIVSDLARSQGAGRRNQESEVRDQLSVSSP